MKKHKHVYSKSECGHKISSKDIELFCIRYGKMKQISFKKYELMGDAK